MKKGPKKRQMSTHRPRTTKGQKPSFTKEVVLQKLSAVHGFYNLSLNERDIARRLHQTGKSQLIEAFTFALHPASRSAIAPGVNHYVLFIDALNSEIYNIVYHILQENTSQLQSFFVTGAADFIVELYTNQTHHNEFIEMLTKKLDLEQTEIVSSFQVDSYPVLWGKAPGPDVRKVFNIDDTIRLECLRKDYLDRETTGLAPSQVSKILNEFVSQGVIVSYYTIRNFLKYHRLRQYIALTHTEDRFVNILIQRDSLRSNILSVYKVRPATRPLNPNYEGISYILVVEFSDFQEYHRWKTTLYDTAKSKGERTNVFTFDVEACLSEKPVGAGDHVAFGKLLRDYIGKPTDSKIILGNPMHFLSGEVISSADITLSVRAVSRHGLICGNMSSGKTSTGILLCRKAIGQFKSVSIIDPTEGTRQKITEGKLPSAECEVVDIKTALANPEFTPFSSTRKIQCYFAPGEQIVPITTRILNIIKNLSDSGQDDDKYRVVNHLVLFEEAGFLGTSNLETSLLDALQVAGRVGVSIWLSTQSPTFLPLGTLAVLENRIFHKPKDQDIPSSQSLLLNKAKDKLYPPDTLGELKLGEAMLSFRAPTSAGNYIHLAPVKARIFPL